MALFIYVVSLIALLTSRSSVLVKEICFAVIDYSPTFVFNSLKPIITFSTYTILISFFAVSRISLTVLIDIQIVKIITLTTSTANHNSLTKLWNTELILFCVFFKSILTILAIIWILIIIILTEFYPTRFVLLIDFVSTVTCIALIVSRVKLIAVLHLTYFVCCIIIVTCDAVLTLLIL